MQEDNVTRQSTEEQKSHIYRAFEPEMARYMARSLGQWLCIDRHGTYWVVGYYRLREAIAKGLVGMPWKR